MRAPNMLIAIIGPPCSGKETIASYLIQHESFNRVTSRPSQTPAKTTTTTVFHTPSQLLDFATLNWRTNYVTTDLTRLEDLEGGFLKRPWFLLVGVEAGVGVRWRRSCSR